MTDQDPREYWNQQAATFDDEADHGLRDAAVRRAWAGLLARWLPGAPRAVLDVGCGTGSLSVLLAEMGHAVTGIDFAPKMIARARRKAAERGLRIDFQVMDAARPRLEAGPFDALLCRHLLWALPDPGAVLVRWAALLKPGGRLVLIEGRWQTGAGLGADELWRLLPGGLAHVQVESLSEVRALWGKAVTDERYAITADLPPAAGE